ncbi:MAG TPA: D-alanyl-D-alanine carboxypeptidase/D-alanyl-D-alanine-endopeptidase [Gemmatimonadales bacterium]|nr:D-alanyl-D-alanine carboxypeptidase/D-alanyl-D-alanine-endopeptidase [Gemmatimonadales bacterium]
MRHHTRRSLRLLAALLVVPAATGAGQSLGLDVQRRISEWYGEAQRRAPGLWGIAIADAEGRVLWSAQPELPLVPASTTKVFTTGFARTRVGGEARRRTRVLGAGYVEPTTGIWRGTWALELNGDPTLERPGRGPTLRDLAAGLRARGIRVLDGPLALTSRLGPATARYPEVWSVRHDGRLFAPPVGPVTIHENVVRFTVKPGRIGQRPILVHAAPAGAEELVDIAATTVAGNARRLSLAPTANGRWILSGTIGRRARPAGFSSVARDPVAVLDRAWNAALGSVGITWRRIVPPTRVAPGTPLRVLSEVVSAPLDSVALEVNRRSVNIGAELLLRWAAGGERPAQALTDHVRAVVGPLARVHFVDGSGLSDHNRITPLTQVLYLARILQTPSGRDFPLLLPANGTGTLRRLRRGLEPGVVHAKTGTLDEASTLLGYLGRRDGMLIVSLMYNGRYPGRARQAQWDLFRMLGAEGANVASLASEQYGGDSLRK